VTNKNFHEFINNERIEEAKKLLKNTNYPISTIAYDLGFNDSNYFSVVFKKFTGKTPKEYRNTLIKIKYIKIK
jgi:two-component system response regulator YesN